MGNLEHNIKEAFAEHDSKTSLSNKDEIWNRLDARLQTKKGVAAIWRVAAVFFGLLLTAGVFAGINQRLYKETEIGNLLLENERLHATVDSLKSTQNKKASYSQIVEKEKIIYKDKVIYKEVASTGAWKKKYENLSDSTKMFEADKKAYEKEIAKLQKDLAHAEKELTAFKDELKPANNENAESPFELKSERIELDVSKTPTGKRSDVEMKILQRNYIENRNNLNSTIFNK